MSIPDAAVEAAAKFLLIGEPFNDEHGLWKNPKYHDYYLSQARAALEAAAPFMRVTVEWGRVVTQDGTTDHLSCANGEGYTRDSPQ